MAQQVAAKWAAAFGFAIGCRSESLFDSFVGLLLWHRDLSNLLASNNRFYATTQLKLAAEGGGSISMEDRRFQSVSSKNWASIGHREKVRESNRNSDLAECQLQGNRLAATRKSAQIAKPTQLNSKIRLWVTTRQSCYVHLPSRATFQFSRHLGVSRLSQAGFHDHVRGARSHGL